jgi:protein farnesyltransferase/geranylgeranyltransferase type-1 subunit alpha
MSQSSDDEIESNIWIPYSQRKEWSDVKPLQQNEGPDPVAKIAYSDKFVDVFNYFRAIVCSGEISQRALDLTQDAAELNPANYSVWHHRRFLLKKLNSNLNQEMDYCRAVIEEHPKNYQVWQHRRALVEALNDSTKELRLTEMVLSHDAKNYHAWQHRQWVIKTFNTYEGELQYIERLLEEDIRNNSAWNHRFYIVTTFPPKEKSSNDETGCEFSNLKHKISGPILQRELQYTLHAINKVSRNESAWNFLRGLLDNCDDSERDELRSNIYTFCIQMQKSGNNSPYLLATIMDLDKEDGLREKDTVKLKNAMEICRSLANDHDPIRKEYWNYIEDDIKIHLDSM